MQTLIAIAAADERRRVCDVLDDCEAIDVVTTCSNGREAAAALRQRQPALVVMDVELPQLSGFEVLRTRPAERRPLVIFAADDERHALRALEVGAVDYLLRPLSPARVRQALQQARTRLEREQTLREIDERVSTLLQRLERQPAPGAASDRYPHRLPVRHHDHVLFVEVKDIDWIEAADDCVRLHVGSTSYQVRSTLSQMEMTLDPKRFLRVHRSRIVNVDRIHEMRPLGSGDYLLVLTDGTELVSSRTYKQERRRILDPLSLL